MASNLLVAKVPTLPTPPLSHSVPMDLDAQEDKTRDQRDLDYLLSNPKKFEEIAAIRRDIGNLVSQLPTKITSTEAIRALGEFAMARQSIKNLSDPDKPDVTRGIKMATALVDEMFDDALEKHPIINTFGVCVKYHLKDEVETADEKAKREQVLLTYHSTEFEKQVSYKHFSIFPLLSKINRQVLSLCAKASMSVPLAACSLNVKLLEEAKAHSAFLKAISLIHVVHKQCFPNLARDGGESVWNVYTCNQGRIAHPHRGHSDDHPEFKAERWIKSVSTHDKVKDEIDMLAVDHPLPTFAGLRRCFTKMENDRNSSNRFVPYNSRDRGRQPRFFFLNRDVVGHLALLLGDLVYNLAVFTDRVPTLAMGKGAAFPERELPHRVVTLGIFIHMAVSYQTIYHKLQYDPFDLVELSSSFEYPPADADDKEKTASFCYRQTQLGLKRHHALPFLLHQRGLKGYNDFLQNPDAWVSAMKGPMRNVVDKVSGSVTAATMRQDKIALAQVQTMEAKTTEQDAAPPEDQENQPQNKKRDCKLLVCSIFMIMIDTFHVDSCPTIIYISLSLFYHCHYFIISFYFILYSIILILSSCYTSRCQTLRN